MLRFAKKPNEVFTQVVTRSLEFALDDLESQIDLIEDGEYDPSFLTSDRKIIKSLGGGLRSILLIHYILTRILYFHLHKNLFMPTDFHFLLLDRCINDYCCVYNDIVDDYEKNDFVTCKGKPVKNLDFGDFIDDYFWDTDYDFPINTAKIINSNKDFMKSVAISQCAINASLGLPIERRDWSRFKYIRTPIIPKK